MNVARLLTRQAVDRPDAVAIIEGSLSRERSITYAQLDARSATFARRLLRDGVKAGDRVLIFVPMSIDLYVVLVAVFRIGAVATFLDPSAGRAHVEHCCAIADPTAFVGTTKAQLLRLTSRGLRAIARKYVVGSYPMPGAARLKSANRRGPSDDVDVSVVDREPTDGALLTFTSGSTGVPKAAVRTHGFLAAQHAALVEALGLEAEAVDLATLPIFALANLATGMTTVIPDADLRRPGSVDPTRVLSQIARHRPTSCVASPAFYERLLAVRSVERQSLRYVRRAFTGGAPVLPDLLRRLAEATVGEAIAVYGSTEAEPIAHVAWSEMTADDTRATAGGKGLLAGVPAPQTETRVIAAAWGEPLGPMSGTDFDALSQPVNGPGEIVVTGEHVLRGYLHGHGDEQTKVHVAGQVWHRTGDVGYFDDRGRLWLLGRAEAVVRDDRGTLFPFAVECAARQVEGVRLAALLAVEGRRVLLLQPELRADSKSLVRAVLEAVAWAKLDVVKIVKVIPLDKRHNAKVDYATLRRDIHRVLPVLG